MTSPDLDSNVHLVDTSVGGIVVSIAAFQAVDPGSIPGRRISFFFGMLELNAPSKPVSKAILVQASVAQ